MTTPSPWVGCEDGGEFSPRVPGLTPMPAVAPLAPGGPALRPEPVGFFRWLARITTGRKDARP
jgi:hypothetical protein